MTQRQGEAVMSIKKATPKGVFDACEQLALLSESWNRDDVRALIGGGSFSVIDPLIQAWRKLQPVREVAPSVPSDLLIQVAGMLELHVSNYIDEISLRDQVREKTLLDMNSAVSDKLEQVESDLTDSLSLSQQVNHELEAEVSRLECELSEKIQLAEEAAFKLAASEVAVKNLNKQFHEKERSYEEALARHTQTHQDTQLRESEHFQKQLSQQKAELKEAAHTAENRLMRLLDQERNELKKVSKEAGVKIEALNVELFVGRQKVATQEIEKDSLVSKDKLLLGQVKLAERTAEQQAKEFKHQLSLLGAENKMLKKKVEEYQTQEGLQGKEDMQQLKDSIALLQKQVNRS